MEREIVETLREWAKNANDQGVVEAVNGLRSAALTIENLMGDVEALKRAIRNNDRDIADLIQQRLELISNADKLRAERDEARREVCKLKAWNAQERLGPEGYALLRKWDCFARDTSEHM